MSAETTDSRPPTPDQRLTPVPQGPFYVEETRAFTAGWETAVRGSDRRRLCTVIERDHMPKESGAVRAAFIVRAVNNHAQLVAAIEQVLDASEDCGDMNDIDWDQLRAALAAAKEVQS